MKRLCMFSSVVLLLIGFCGGALSYRWYVNTYIIRQAPPETEERPVFDGPVAGTVERPEELPAVEERRIVQPDDIKVSPHAEGFLVWEAEWANAITGSFDICESPDASGDVALWSREGTGRDNEGAAPRVGGNNPLIKMGSAEWVFDLPAAGEYRLFMRVWALDKCGNSCWVGMDAESLEALHYFPGGGNGQFGAARHVWPESMLRRWLWIDDEGSRYKLGAGTHTLRVDVREDGFAVDQIALVPVQADTEPAGHEPNSILPQAAGESFASGLALQNYNLNDGVTLGRYWLRLNGAAPQDVELEFDAQGATVLPSDSFAATLTPERPVVQVPFQLRLPADSPRRAYAVSATVRSGGKILESASVHFASALDWWALGPLSYEEERAVGSGLRSAAEIDVTRSPLASRPRLAWTRVQAKDHYDPFGAIDLARLFGPQEQKTAYLVTKIRVLRSGVYRILAAGDDTVMISIGGKSVVNDFRSAPLTDTLRPYTVMLDEGTHLVIASTRQYRRWWQVFVEFQTPDGEPAVSIVGQSMTD